MAVCVTRLIRRIRQNSELNVHFRGSAGATFHFFRDLVYFWRFGRLGLWGHDDDDETGLTPESFLQTENRQNFIAIFLAILNITNQCSVLQLKYGVSSTPPPTPPRVLGALKDSTLIKPWVWRFCCCCCVCVYQGGSALNSGVVPGLEGNEMRPKCTPASVFIALLKKGEPHTP